MLRVRTKVTKKIQLSPELGGFGADNKPINTR